ncbi:MAG: type II toxin-antitoxin system Phd/YefM family antitoxin [Candidatus Margulisiibacteriota bacterium]
MQASVVELRTKMKDITRALERHETVTILSHGKPIGQLEPFSGSVQKTNQKVASHSYFGSLAQTTDSVEAIMDRLRGSRYAL